jgi:protein-S-isoprenylcysteine O-methyltransferase Ste14
MADRPPILPPALGLLMMLGVFTAHFIRPIGLIFPYPLNYLGLLPIVIGAALNILADREMRLKGAVEHLENDSVDNLKLVTSGVYRFSRNPAYLGLIFIIAGLAVWVGTLSPWLVVLVFPVVLTRIYIRAEEQRLMALYGLRYEQYCRLVPRWVQTRFN